MTSILSVEESNVIYLKKLQLQNAQSIGKSCVEVSSHDETHSFHNFSRENLSILNSEFEQDFSETPRMRYCSRQTLISCAAMFLALSCAGLELWKLRCVVMLTLDVETLKRDVEMLKHRFLEKDLLDELKAFEKQLYSENSSETDDSSSLSLSDDSDYDSSYDESSAVPFSPVVDYQTVASAPSNIVASDTINARTAFPAQSKLCSNKYLEDVFTMLRRAEANRNQSFEQKIRQRKKLLKEERTNERLKLVSEHHSTNGVEKSKRQVEGSGRTRRQDYHKRLKYPLEK